MSVFKDLYNDWFSSPSEESSLSNAIAMAQEDYAQHMQAAQQQVFATAAIFGQGQLTINALDQQINELQQQLIHNQQALNQNYINIGAAQNIPTMRIGEYREPTPNFWTNSFTWNLNGEIERLVPSQPKRERRKLNLPDWF